MRRCCKTCKYYWCGLMATNGEPFEDDGICRDPEIHRGRIEADDLCNNYKEANWVKAKAKGGEE